MFHRQCSTKGTQCFDFGVYQVCRIVEGESAKPYHFFFLRALSPRSFSFWNSEFLLPANSGYQLRKPPSLAGGWLAFFPYFSPSSHVLPLLPQPFPMFVLAVELRTGKIWLEAQQDGDVKTEKGQTSTEKKRCTLQVLLWCLVRLQRFPPDMWSI